MPGQPSRTSDSHPITLSWVVEHQGGRLGLCFCPGKQVTRSGVAWHRTLSTDLQRLKDHFGVTCLVCLLSPAELQSFRLRDYAAGVAAAGLDLETFPIIEMQAPQDMQATAELIDRIAARLQQGQVLAMHCRGGVGRAGLIAACVLLRTGQCTTPQAAIAHVRRKRCKQAVETKRQEDFVAAYCRREELGTDAGVTGRDLQRT